MPPRKRRSRTGGARGSEAQPPPRTLLAEAEPSITLTGTYDPATVVGTVTGTVTVTLIEESRSATGRVVESVTGQFQGHLQSFMPEGVREGEPPTLDITFGPTQE